MTLLNCIPLDTFLKRYVYLYKYAKICLWVPQKSLALKSFQKVYKTMQQ